MQKLKYLAAYLLLISTTAVQASTLQQVGDLIEYVDNAPTTSSTETFFDATEQLDAITDFPTAIWTKTLNFRYIYYGATDQERTIRTGKSGNTYLVSGESCLTLGRDNLNELFSETNKQKRKATVKLSDTRQVPMQRDFQGKFDLDELHKKLQDEEKQSHGSRKEHNYVLAGVSLIFETHEPDQYEALFSFYRNPLPTSKNPKKATDDEKSINGPIYVSESGQSEAKPQKSNDGYERVKAVYGSDDISPKKLWHRYHERWEPPRKRPRVVQKLQEAVKSKKKEITNKVNEELQKVEDINNPLNSVATNMRKVVLDGYFGAMTDSEQSFLCHALYPLLNQVTANNQLKPRRAPQAASRIEGQYTQLMEDYRIYKKRPQQKQLYYVILLSLKLEEVLR